MIRNRVITGIAAINQQNILGIDGHMPWGKIKTDLAFYKSMTVGKTLICGGNTFRSLPPAALKNRKIVVLTRHKPANHPDNIMFLDNYVCPGFVMEDISHFVDSDEVMIVGGGLIYKFFEFQYDKFYLTTIDGMDFDTEGKNTVYFDVDLKSIESEKKWTRKTISTSLVDNDIGDFKVTIQELS